MVTRLTPEIVVRILRNTPLPVSTDPVIMDILGVKSDQSRGITDPTLGMEARQKDDSRMRKLAMKVLGIAQDLGED